MRLKGKTAIVTGAGQGLGEGIALRYAQEGANIAIVDKNPETTPAVAAKIEKAGGKAIPIVADLYQVANIDRAVETTMKAFGRVDILVAKPKGYGYLSGTSMATAYVTGLSALMISRVQDLTPVRLRKLLEASATDLGPPQRDPEFGAGRIDASVAFSHLAAN